MQSKIIFKNIIFKKDAIFKVVEDLKKMVDKNLAKDNDKIWIVFDSCTNREMNFDLNKMKKGTIKYKMAERIHSWMKEGKNVKNCIVDGKKIG